MHWSLSIFITFLILGFGGSFVTYFALRHRASATLTEFHGVSTRIAISMAVAAAAGIIVFAGTWALTPTTLGPEPTLPWSLIAAYVLMLAGMAASYMNKLI